MRQYGQWALVLFVFGFLMQGVNNFAHAGGFVGGFAAGLVLALAERRAETAFDQLLALALPSPCTAARLRPRHLDRDRLTVA